MLVKQTGVKGEQSVIGGERVPQTVGSKRACALHRSRSTCKSLVRGVIFSDNKTMISCTTQ